jgi:hypothetical protein
MYAPEAATKAEQQMEAYCCMPDSVLFRVQAVKVSFSDADLPGPTRYKAVCRRCGQVVRDRREITADGLILCRPCAQGGYLDEIKEITWPDMCWAPGTTAGLGVRLSLLSGEESESLPPDTCGCDSWDGKKSNG